MEGPSRYLIFDPFAGVSGDMLLAGLLDLGLASEWLVELVAALPLDAVVDVERVRRGSLMASAVRVHSAADQPLRSLTDLLEIVEKTRLDSEVRETAARTLRRLADVEAELHGVAVDDVHFHEIGAVDTLVDVLGCCAAVRELAVDACFTRPVGIGSGTVRSQHGELPLPAPATLRMLEGLPTRETGFAGEATTPTGAALLAELTHGRRAAGGFTPLRSGFGAGSRDPATHPNLIRVILVQTDVAGELFVVQCDIDDLSPEYVPPLLEELLEHGAVDVFTQSVGMKKGRTGVRIEALVPGERRLETCRRLLEESTTLGVRFWPVSREVLPRGTRTLEWRGFPIRVKLSVTPDGHLRQKAEYEDVLRAARSLGLPVLQVRERIKRKLDLENSEP